jgi:DNA-binding Xre family transcriptional regulator
VWPILKNNLPVTMAKLGYRTYKEIAEKTGLTETTVSKLMRSELGPGERIYFETIETLCRSFHIQVTDIFEYVHEEDQ